MEKNTLKDHLIKEIYTQLIELFMKTNIDNPSKKAYSQIFKLMKKHKDLCFFDISNLEEKSKYHLFGIELKETYGLDIDPNRISSLDYIKLKEYIDISWFGDDNIHKRTISWPDCGNQPKNEFLLRIGFSTGPYIFDDDYPTKLFQDFFLELKTYKPKFTDSANKSLYFTLDNAKDVFNNFNDIINKYHTLNKEDRKQRTIKKMEEDLEKLKRK